MFSSPGSCVALRQTIQYVTEKQTHLAFLRSPVYLPTRELNGKTAQLPYIDGHPQPLVQRCDSNGRRDLGLEMSG